MDNKLLSACLKSRDAYERIKDSVEEKITSPAALQLLELCSAYYANDASATAVDVDWMAARIDSLYDNPKKAKEYKDVLQDVVSTEVSIPNIVDLIFEAKKRDLAHRLAIALANDDPKVDDLLEDYQQLNNSAAREEDDEILHNYSAEQSIAEVLDTRNLIRLPTKALTDICEGGAQAGDHIVVVARPEIGKTALSVSFARVFAHQGLDGLYFGNEDPIKRIAVRAQSCFSGLTKEEIKVNPAELNRRLAIAHWDKVRFVPIHGKSDREIRRYVKMYKPKWIVVDQIRNLVVRADTRTNQLEAAATAMRNIAGEYGLVCVSVTQAGDSAEGKLTLGMGDIDNSNTGIPAQADLLVMMGADDVYMQEGYRQINLPKNKLSGNHTYFRVKINPRLSRIEDV